MIYRIRLLVSVLLLEGLLGYLWWAMVQPDAAGGNHLLDPGAPERISEVMGAVMGGLLGFAIILYFVARWSDRRRQEARTSLRSPVARG